MRSRVGYEEALRRSADGLNDSEFARLTGVPRRTFYDWRRSERQRSGARHTTGCPVCSPAAACDALGIEWRPLGERDISIARRDCVAKLDTFIGPKC